MSFIHFILQHVIFMKKRNSIYLPSLRNTECIHNSIISWTLCSYYLPLFLLLLPGSVRQRTGGWPHSPAAQRPHAPTSPGTQAVHWGHHKPPDLTPAPTQPTRASAAQGSATVQEYPRDAAGGYIWNRLSGSLLQVWPPLTFFRLSALFSS